MRITRFLLLIIFLFTTNSSLCAPSIKFEDILLKDIAKNIEDFRNKTITLKLKLKNIDINFDKMVFYDRKNYDIYFDISIIKKNKLFQRDFLNLHEGMEYLVQFIIRDVTEGNVIIGDLLSFKSIVLLKLPEGYEK